MFLKGFKTLAFNVVAGAIPVLDMTEASDIIPEQYLPHYALFMAVFNAFLRFKTDTAVGKAS